MIIFLAHRDDLVKDCFFFVPIAICHKDIIGCYVKGEPQCGAAAPLSVCVEESPHALYSTRTHLHWHTRTSGDVFTPLVRTTRTRTHTHTRTQRVVQTFPH